MPEARTLLHLSPNSSDLSLYVPRIICEGDSAQRKNQELYRLQIYTHKPLVLQSFALLEVGLYLAICEAVTKLEMTPRLKPVHKWHGGLS